MQAGPGIVLVADDTNVSIDETGNRRGLLYSQKGKLSGSNLEKLNTVLRSALENCQRLEKSGLPRQIEIYGESGGNFGE